MKNSLTVLFFTILLVWQGITAEHVNIGMVDNPFFTRTDSVVTIRSLIPHDTQIIAVVDASTEFETKTMTIAPLYSKSWVNNDYNCTARENILATLVCGSKIVDKNILRDIEVPYTFVKESEFQTGDLSPGKTVKVVKTKEYTRPDGSLYRRLEEDLYSLTMKRESVDLGLMSVCGKEWTIISQWKQKLRHCRSFYTANDIYHITVKQMLKEGLILTGSKPEEIARVFIQRELKFSYVDQESPECGSLGRSVPGGVVLI
jgi:hypothetical protein